MDRKETVKILGEHFGVKPQYMGVPSFAYEIETAKGAIIIDKKGKIKNSEGEELELEELLNDYEVVEPQVEMPKEESKVTLSMDGHTGITLRNLVNMISSKQSLIKKALELEKDIVTRKFVEGINGVRIDTIEDFKTAALEIGLEKCPGINFDFEKGMLRFSFINTETAILFAEALNESAKKFKHSSPKEKQTDNEKYTFRTWLLRLGFIGDRYKRARKELLKNLGGNSAFRKGKEGSKDE
ncbi:virulence-related protein [Clostridium tetani]|uniref:virulence-related protein n=1 Tax=Clostridium tetani TaxID=1513 RepID=UPI00100AE4D3|nr:virulence-related protein [Clostridium tetani]RXM74058.1 virulence-related protein [Clostridium tetani]RYU97960.1 virulence-related protein [Clostridium tetani]